MQEVRDSQGNLTEVIRNGKRFYPPMKIVHDGITVTSYRPILTDVERTEFENGIREASLIQ